MAANSYHLHFHKRQKKKVKKTTIDYLIYFAVILGPLMTFPQVYDVWVMKMPGVSLATWAAYTLVAIIWLTYGIKHREMPIIALQFLWLVMDLAVVTGVVMRVNA